MTKLLIKNVLHRGVITNVLINGNRFERIGADVTDNEAQVLDGSEKAILPPFYNGHTHAGMSIMRSYADDMPLFKWLTEHIWPMEAKLSAREIYVANRLSILEMIKSGTVFFADMYWQMDEAIRAADEMGVRVSVGRTLMDNLGEAQINDIFRLSKQYISPRISHAITPHAIYTVSEKLLRRCAEEARENGLILHIHLAETKQEVDDCQREHGMSPVRYLESIGFLGDDVVAAHMVHLDDDDIRIAKEQGVTLVHNPCSNMKLSSGVFRYKELIESGCRIALGTDGSASNNNLDMQEEMKFASLLAKSTYAPETLPAEEVFRWATVNGACAFGIDAGEIAEGKLADAILLDLNNERLIPNFNLISNWVYAANSGCVDSVICDGKILMRNGHIEKEEEIIEDVKRLVCDTNFGRK